MKVLDLTSRLRPRSDTQAVKLENAGRHMRVSVREAVRYEVTSVEGLGEMDTKRTHQGSTGPQKNGGLPPIRAKWGGGCAPSPSG